MIVLVVEEGPSRGARIGLAPGTSLLVGRAPDCHLVSGCAGPDRHARIDATDDRVTLTDQSGGLETAVNGLPLDDATDVRPGDRIRLGESVVSLVEEVAPGYVIPADRPTIGEPRTVYGAGRPRDRADGSADVASRVLALLPRIQVGGRAELEGSLEETLACAGGQWAELRDSSGASLAASGRRGSSGAATFPLEWEGRPVGTLEVGGGERVPVQAAWSAVATVLAPRVAAWSPSTPATAPSGSRPDVELVARTGVMARVVESIRRVAPGDATILVLGESGTGKEVVARAIHATSRRSRQPLVAVNAAALTESLLESELFGHEKGAFTGAIARRLGVFELAHRGTLFLDEIGEISPSTQAKLLRVLETGEIRRVGGSETRRVDVRLVAATNRDLRMRVRDGLFREDLFYRIAVVEIRLPPLRERAEDLVPLCEQLLKRLGREQGRAPASIDDDAVAALRGHPFPGNVRELRNLLERALLFGDGRRIREIDLPPEVRMSTSAAVGGGGSLKFLSLNELERGHVEAALRLTHWNKKRAAELLQVDRKTLYAKIASFGLKPTLEQTDPEPHGGEESLRNDSG